MSKIVMEIDGNYVEVEDLTDFSGVFNIKIDLPEDPAEEREA